MGQSASQAGPGGQLADNELFFGGDTITRRPGVGAKRFKHPMAALFHVLFKSLALLFYIFGGLFGQDFTSTFVAVILLTSMDFWVVKNVTGRLLVGLRWSNYIDDEGNSHWLYENKNANKEQAERDRLAAFQDETSVPPTSSSADASIFWTGLIMSQTMWTMLMLTALFKFNIQWLMLVILASVLSLSNLYGYTRCRLGTSDIKSSVTQFVAKQVFLNFLTGGSSNK